MKRVLLSCLLSFIVCLSAFAQQGITGKVIDEEKLPLIGVNVIIQGTTTDTITDIDVNYEIKALLDAILEFSFIGYNKEIIEIGGRSVIDISVSPNIE